jgi:hypothetical protein
MSNPPQKLLDLRRTGKSPNFLSNITTAAMRWIR